MKNYLEFINEGTTYRYGAIMLYFDFPKMKELHSKIDKDDIYIDEKDPSYGLETKPHCTLLYGLHKNVTIKEVKDIVKNYEFKNIKAHNISLFENEYDVLKFDIKGDNLKECNKELRNLPHTNDYPDYHPHMTVSYLIKGTGKKYTKMFKGEKFELKPSHIVYSHSNGKKTRINL